MLPNSKELFHTVSSSIVTFQTRRPAVRGWILVRLLMGITGCLLSSACWSRYGRSGLLACWLLTVLALPVMAEEPTVARVSFLIPPEKKEAFAKDYRERVRINGKMLSAEAHADSFAFIEAGRGDTTLTYFEFTTLSALKLFQDAALDVVILEVGLGGRLDAANIVSADVAVITTIDVDHADWLGTDTAVIATEKAGIFRAGKKAICGVINPPVTIAEYAHKVGADLIAVNKDYSYQQDRTHWTWQSRPAVSPMNRSDSR